MSKLILLILVGLLAYVLLKGLRRPRTPSSSPPPSPPVAENMVSCAVCGVHLPESESIAGNGRHYCCEEHRRQAQ